MKLRTWKYYIKQGLRGVFKNGLMSIASVFIVSACIFVVIVSLCIITNVDNILNQIQNNVGVTLYLGNAPTDEQATELVDKFKSMQVVSDVKFKTADEALEDAKTMWSNNSLDGLKEDNPLPRSIEIKLVSLRNQKDFIRELEQLQWDFEKELIQSGQVNAEIRTKDDDDPSSVNISNQASSQGQASDVTTQSSEGAITTQAPSITSSTSLIDDNKSWLLMLPFTKRVNASTPPVVTTVATTVAQTVPQTQPQTEQQGAPNPGIMVEENTEITTYNSSSRLGDADYEFKGIEIIRHTQGVTETLLTIDTVFKIIALAIVGILCAVAIGIITNTIKLTVFIRKNEIGIMKYVGATDWFIRWPFIIEGLIIGLIGATIPSGLCFLGYYKLYEFFTSKYSAFRSMFELRTTEELFIIIIPISLIVGMLIGAVGSITSIRKHLNV